MRVLIVTNMYPTGELPTAGLFIERQLHAMQMYFPHIEFHVCHVDTVRDKLQYLLGLKTVLESIREFQPNLVHIHYGLTQLICWPILKLPVIVTLHGSDLTIGWQRRLTRLAMYRRRAVVLVSETLRQYVLEWPRITCIPCGVDSERFAMTRDNARSRLDLNQRDRIILFGSNPSRQVKRYDRFEAAIDAIGNRVENMRAMRLSDVCVDDAPVLIAAADVLVLTSDREGSPVVTKEALCAGTRVVSTPVGDVADQLRDFEGCRVTGWDAGEIATDVCIALQQPAPNSVLAAQRFDHAVECTLLEKLYRDMVMP